MSRTGAATLEAYYRGISEHDPDFVIARLDVLSRTLEVSAEAITIATAQLPPVQANVDRLLGMLQSGHVNADFVAQLVSRSWIDTLSSDNAYRLLDLIAGTDGTNSGSVTNFLEHWIVRQRPLEERLIQLGWLALCGSKKPRSLQQYDDVAWWLVQIDPSGGLQALLILFDDTKPTGWFPIQHDPNRFWHYLRKRYPEIVIRRLLEFVKSTEGSHAILSYSYDAYSPDTPFVLSEDHDVLLAYAFETEEQTVLVSSLLPSIDSAFWSVVLAIKECYPISNTLMQVLNTVILRKYRGIGQPSQSQIEASRAELARVIADTDTQDHTRVWLTNLSQALADIP